MGVYQYGQNTSTGTFCGVENEDFVEPDTVRLNFLRKIYLTKIFINTTKSLTKKIQLFTYRRHHFNDFPEGIQDEQWLRTWLQATDENRLDDDLVENLAATYESFM